MSRIQRRNATAIHGSAANARRVVHRATPRSIVAIPERPLFLFEILIGLLGAHSIAAIHGERNEHTCHNREIECKETPNER